MAAGADAGPTAVDLHTHILPPGWPDLEALHGGGRWLRLEREGRDAGRLMQGEHCFRRIDSRCWDPARRLEDCDAAGIGLQVLSTVPVMFSYWAPAAAAADLSRLLNDHIAGVVAAHPRRFAGLGTVPMQDPDLAVAELERCMRQLGLAGIEIGTHVNGANLDDPAVFPVLEAARDLGAAVFVHPWDMLAPERMSKYMLRWLVGMPAETALALCSVILGGVLDRLPGLRLAFAHGGGAYPALAARVDHAWRARADLVAVDSERTPRDSLGQVWVDSLVHDEAALARLLELFGPGRVVLGSDYPFPLGEEPPGAVLERMAGLDPAVRDRVRSRNALEFLGLDRAHG